MNPFSGASALERGSGFSYERGPGRISTGREVQITDASGYFWKTPKYFEIICEAVSLPHLPTGILSHLNHPLIFSPPWPS